MSELSVRPVNEHLQKIAIEQLNEVPESIRADIAALRTWIKQQPHLRARDDDQFLISFLRGSKYSLEKAKSKIDKFYTLRTKYPEFFAASNADEAIVREIINAGLLLLLPTPLNEHGPRIILIRQGQLPAEKYKFDEFARAISHIQEIIIRDDDYAIISGMVSIIDVERATPAHVMQMTPSIMKKMSVQAEEAVPLRPKQQHFIHTPSGFETFFNLLKPMMTKKQQERISVHAGKLDRFYDHIPLRYLPVEYGGDNGSIKEIISYTNKQLDDYREYFKENVNYGTDESLRVGKPIDFESMFGVEGSFRKLEVD
ncbi:PREDICTED: alpha-tocopherol transfer protein-like [Rhagoletis zephyria]|uniref:alpha-tocopherol transfer protein-like n=1 Tax=Rhagoletis zephyria TaxID=28612 RepID=UPI0008114304|nr:PREDICTED: alpha-tocopherol transfer protein-like [Rhagoletis zephyria]